MLRADGGPFSQAFSNLEALFPPIPSDLLLQVPHGSPTFLTAATINSLFPPPGKPCLFLSPVGARPAPCTQWRVPHHLPIAMRPFFVSISFRWHCPPSHTRRSCSPARSIPHPMQVDQSLLLMPSWISLHTASCRCFASCHCCHDPFIVRRAQTRLPCTGFTQLAHPSRCSRSTLTNVCFNARVSGSAAPSP